MKFSILSIVTALFVASKPYDPIYLGDEALVIDTI